jgi:hypothetical protein
MAARMATPKYSHFALASSAQKSASIRSFHYSSTLPDMLDLESQPRIRINLLAE